MHQILFKIPTPWGSIPIFGFGIMLFVAFALGTFYAAMSSRSRSREVLLPLLLFPMMIPALLASVQASTALLSGDLMREAGAWVRLLIAYDVIFVAACLAAFEYAIEV